MIRRFATQCVGLLNVLLFVTSAASMIAQTSVYEDISYSKGTFFGGPKNDSYLLHVAVDAKGYIYGTGFCTDIPATANAYQKNCAGSFDVMVFKMDPTMSTLIWATYIGGTESDAGGSIAVNSAGEVYVSGYTYSPNFPISVMSDKSFLSNGQVSIFALKLSADGGRLIYSRILGNGAPVQQQSQNASKGAFVCVNPKDEAYVFSYIPSGAPFTITNNAFQRTPGGAFDLVLSRIDPLGNITYATHIGGSGGDVARDMCYAKGKVYLCGSTSSPNFPRNTVRTPVGFDSFVMVVDDIAVPRIRKSFVYGSTGNDFGTSICYDSRANRLLLGGTAEYGNIPATKVLQPTQIAGGYIAGVDSGLTRLQFLTMLGTGVTPTSIAARSNSSIYIAGYVIGSVPVTPNAFQPNARGDIDGTLITLDSSGSTLRYGTFIGGNAPDYSAAKVLIYESGCVLRVIFGITTHSLNFPASSDSFQPLKLNGGEDQGALVLFSTTGDIKLNMSTKTCAREVTLGISAACPPLDVLWDFGDGTVPVHGMTNITHRYAVSGTYTLVAKLAYAKPDTVMIQRIISISGPAGIEAGANQTVCIAGTRVQLRASGARRLAWFPGRQYADSTQAVQDVTPKVTTTYYVRGTDSTGCESIDSVTVYVLDRRSFAAKDTTVCEGQSVILRIATTSLVQWLPSASLNTTIGSTVVVTATTSGVYTAIISEGPCSDTATFRINVRALPHISMPAPHVLCFSNSTLLQASAYGQYPGDTAGMRIQWRPTTKLSNPNSFHTTVSPTTTTTYVMTVTTRDGCVKSDSVRVTVQNALPLKVISDTVICNGSAIRIWATGGAKYRWYPSTGLSDATIASPLCSVKQTTNYTVVASNGSCIDSAHITVRVGTNPTVQARGDTTVCSMDRVCLRVRNPQTGVQYTWSPAADFENPLGDVVFLRSPSTKTYTVTARTSSGCSATATAVVRINNSLNVSALQVNPVCEGELTTIRITSPSDSTLRYTWIPNDGTYNPVQRTYTAIAKANHNYVLRADRGNCFGTCVVATSVKSSPQFTVGSDTTVCEGQVLILRAKSTDASVRFRWTALRSDSNIIETSADAATIRTSPMDSTTVFRVVADKAGCIQSKDVRVVVHQRPALLVPPDAMICSGQRVQLHIDAPGMRSINWYPSLGLSTSNATDVIASPMQTTTYQIHTVDSMGCTNDAALTIKVRPNTTIKLSMSSSYAKSGDDVVLSVRAMSDQNVRSSVDFDVVCDAAMFNPADTSRTKIINDKRIIHVHLDSLDFTSKAREVERITGTTMVSTSSTSEVSIESAEVAADVCPVVIATPGVIAINSCFYSGRAIQLTDSLRMSVSPSPLKESCQLRIHSAERGRATVELFDLNSQCMKTWSVDHGENDTVHELDFSSYANSEYVIRVSCGYQVQSLRVVKLP